ncbi:MAG: DUF1772 domain-containing protein [Hyphomicrobiaceae bacterium]
MDVQSDPRTRPGWHAMARDAAFFVALVATGIALGGALAHALELPNKIGLPKASYFIVQRIYDGWWQLAYVLAVELAAMLAVLVLSWRDTLPFRLALFAIVAVLAAQAVFWIWTWPANVATRNWTMVPDNWEALRWQWEFSHLGGAVLQLLAFCALSLAALAHRDREGGEGETALREERL